jgi:phosphonate metabolism-associated iron-containing alcohol dehydrogenase
MATFYNPVRIRFGAGESGRISAETEGTCCIVTSAGMLRRGVIERLQQSMGGRIRHVYASVEPNPTVHSVAEAAYGLLEHRADWILAIGGGSVLDTAKAVAAQANAPEGWIAQHLRNGAVFPAPFRPLPIIAVPTTSGTGSEVTPWATIWDEASGVKYSLSHASLFPVHAFVDPELTLSAPADLTIATALDALSHAMESIWNHNANPVSDALAARAIALIPAALRKCLADLSDFASRERLQQASLLAGMAISGTRTALAHSISYPLTGELRIPHGLACSLALPEILAFNGAAAPERVQAIVDALGATSVNEACDKLAQFLADIGMGILLARHASRASMMGIRTSFITASRSGNNIRVADQASAKGILDEALERCGVA